MRHFHITLVKSIIIWCLVIQGVSDIRTASCFGESVQTAPQAPDPKQIGLIRARIFSREGQFHKAFDIYQQLRKTYPTDEEVWEDYIETIVHIGLYELAFNEISALLEKYPNNIRGRRIEAGIYHELGLHERTFPIFESILRQYPMDAGVWFDYGMKKADTGEWAEALDYFCRVLELDPENETALRYVHHILKTRSPAIDSSFSALTYPDGDAQVNTFSVKYSQHLIQDILLELKYLDVSIKRTEGIYTLGLDQSVQNLTANAYIRFNRFWKSRIGIGKVSGLGNGYIADVGLEYKLRDNLVFRADYLRGHPWYDPVEAASYNGEFDRITVSADWLKKKWGMYLGFENRLSFTEDRKKYGTSDKYSAIVTRQISENPNLYLGYSFLLSDFNYQDDNFKPISMISAEKIHALFWNFNHRFCGYRTLSLGGGIRYDAARSLNSWYITPAIHVRFGNRTESALSYEYSSNTGNSGGRSGSFIFNIKIIF